MLPVLLAALLVIGVATGAYAASTEGPGSKHAPLLLALVVALVIGALAQKSRMCFAEATADVILMKNFDLLSIIAALFAVMTIYNIATGNFHLSFSGQPIAHSQHLWNILGMYVVGFAAVLAGGCPLRQLILAGQGSSDSSVTFLGMLWVPLLHTILIWSAAPPKLPQRPMPLFPAARHARQDCSHRLHCTVVCDCSNQPAP